MWLADMHYRVAARQQQRAWVDIAALMESLFGRMRDIELSRKAVFKELLAATVRNVTIGTRIDGQELSSCHTYLVVQRYLT
jgi:hypothetical protein